ncbi:MAG: metal ABC transporter ATP-binding protein [Clostridia bacterium]|nr:metal ABC transporter ATP-binding protein [Clostridia bacterium]
MPIISIDKLSSYYDNRQVFSELSFDVEDGDYICITGENGSGKTTLMQCILGFDIKYKGSIIFNGFSRRDIGWLPQKSDTKSDFPASVSEVIFSGFAGKSVLGIAYSSAQKEKAYKNMALLEVEDLKDKSFNELSGGQQQKVLLCRALCAAQKVILLDEPVNSLDAASQNEFYSLLKKINNSGITVIMISHDIERAVKEAHKILNISNNGFTFKKAECYLEDEYKTEGNYGNTI